MWREIVKTFYVYILTNHSRRLYLGVTNNLERRLAEHRTGVTPGFATKYRMDKLVYFEVAYNASAAIEREKQLKGLLRRKKIELIEKANPHWEDLSEGWGRPASRGAV